MSSLFDADEPQADPVRQRAPKTTRTKRVMNKYLIIVQAEATDDDPEGVRHLRMALKRMLRNYGLECKGVRPIK